MVCTGCMLWLQTNKTTRMRGIDSPAGRWAAIAVLMLAFLLRLVRLQSRSLWYDEAFAVLFAERGLRAILYGTLTRVGGAAADVHPVVYYAALNGWMRLVGTSPFAARMLSALVGTLTVAFLFDLGRRIFGARAGLVTAGLAVLSPFHVYYSQETRMYSAMALGGIASVWFLATSLRVYASNITARALRWGGLALSAAFAMYMQNLAAFFLLTLGLAALPRPRAFRRVALAGLGALALYLPWLVQVPGQFAKLQQAYWVARPTLVSLVQTALIFHVGEESLATGNIASLPLVLGLVASVLGPSLLLFQCWRGWKTRRPGVHWAAFALALAAGPPVLMFLVSQYQPIYLQRALLPSALMYYLGLGWAIARGGMPRPVGVVLVGVLGATSLGGLAAHYTFDQFPRPDFPAVTAFLAGQASPADAIVHSNKLTYFPIRYYNRSLSQTFVADPPGSGSDTLAYPTQAALGEYAKPGIEAAAGSARRVWFVIFDRAILEYQAQGMETHPDLAWLESRYEAAGVRHFGDLAVYQFTK